MCVKSTKDLLYYNYTALQSFVVIKNTFIRFQ